MIRDARLNIRVWATSPWLDLRVHGGRRNGRLSYAFPVMLVLSFGAMWLAGVQ